MNILYIGSTYNKENSYLLGKAFNKIGNKVFWIDPLGNTNTFFSYIISFINYRLDTKIFNFYFMYQLKKHLRDNNLKINFIILVQIEFYDQSIINFLKKKFNCKIISYINDNPFTKRDNKRFLSFNKAIDFYDYFFVVRNETYRVLKKK